MSTVTQRPTRGYWTLRLPISETDYERYPELFPLGFDQGYAVCGFGEPSRKQWLRCRRVRLSAEPRVWTVTPAFVMPFMTAVVSEVEKALLLMRFHVPCWALASVFERDVMCWYRLEQSLGRFSGVGTTVKAAQRLPQDLVADEKKSLFLAGLI